jgi:hypothetical protein
MWLFGAGCLPKKSDGNTAEVETEVVICWLFRVLKVEWEWEQNQSE